MHYRLDIRTLSLTSGFISLILCICMLYISRSRRTYSGFLHWTVASILNSFGLLFLSLRGFLPDFITVIIANTLIVTASGIVAYGIEIFTGCTRRVWLFISLAVCSFVSFSYFTYYNPNVNARIVIISVILSALYAYCGHVVHGIVPRLLDVQNILLAVVFGVLAIWFGWRIVPTVFIEGHIANFMQAPTLQGVSIMVFWGGNIFVIIGLIILNFQRVEIELLASTKEIKTLRGIIPICASCKKIRDDKGIWEQIEKYIRDHSDAEFSHGFCPECVQKLYPEFTRKDKK